MKTWTKISTIGIFCLTALLINVSSSMAAKVTATITKVTVTEWTTPSSSNYAIYATSPSWGGGTEERYFYIMPTTSTEGYYATCLTALSLGQPVEMNVLSLTSGSLIDEISLLAPTTP